MYAIVTSIMVFYLIFLEGFTRIRLLEMSSDLGIELCDDEDAVNMTKVEDESIFVWVLYQITSLGLINVLPVSVVMSEN